MNEEISMRESIETGAPNIKYNRGDIRMGMEEDTQGKQIAAEIWSQMEPEQKSQFPSFDAFFQSGIWKQIIQQLQQDQSGVASMQEDINVAEKMPGGGIADVNVNEKVAMRANGGIIDLYNRGM
tara:strand:+ start:193 stop:564 length:372 start_codon:yes stop_codon:yes gene_type:complete